MTVHDHEGLAREARRAHIEALLGDYPQISEQEVSLLKTWFQRQASALDVAQVASNPEIAEQYRAFRTEHVDKIGARDMGKAAIAVIAIVLCIVAIMWRAL